MLNINRISVYKRSLGRQNNCDRRYTTRKLHTKKTIPSFKNLIMEWKAVVIVVFAGLMATATGTPISDCSARFQQSLTEVLQLKQTCATAMYQDCCQVTTIHYTLNMCIIIALIDMQILTTCKYNALNNNKFTHR